MSQETISNERNNLNNSNFHSNSYTVYNHIYSKTDQQQPEETSFKPIERKGLQINFFFSANCIFKSCQKLTKNLSSESENGSARKRLRYQSETSSDSNFSTPAKTPRLQSEDYSNLKKVIQDELLEIKEEFLSSKKFCDCKQSRFDSLAPLCTLFRRKLIYIDEKLEHSNFPKLQKYVEEIQIYKEKTKETYLKLIYFKSQPSFSEIDLSSLRFPELIVKDPKDLQAEFYALLNNLLTVFT